MLTLQEELDALAETLSLSLTIDTPDGEVLAYSAHHGDLDAARVSAILRHHVAPDVRAWQQQHVSLDTDEPVHVPPNAGLAMTARLCVPLRLNGRTVGLLWALLNDSGDVADAESTLNAAGARLARLVVGSIERPVVPRATNPQRTLDRLLRAVLLGDHHAADAADALTARVPRLVTGAVRMVSVLPSGEAFSAREYAGLRSGLNQVLSRVRGHVASDVSRTAVSVLLIEASPPDTVPAVVSQVHASVAGLVGRATYAGHAGPVDLLDAAPAQLRARHAARAAAADPRLGPIAAWSELGVYLSVLGHRQPAAVLGPLLNAGASAHMLTETLETFLDLGGDMGRAAAELAVHRSTLHYRLGRVMDLVGVDLADGLTRLRLHLALKELRAASVGLGRDSTP